MKKFFVLVSIGMVVLLGVLGIYTMSKPEPMSLEEKLVAFAIESDGLDEDISIEIDFIDEEDYVHYYIFNAEGHMIYYCSAKLSYVESVVERI